MSFKGSVLIRVFYFLTFSILLQSCATILNGPNTHIWVNTDKPSKIVFLGDTVNTYHNSARIKVPRKKDSLELEIIGDSISKHLSITSKTSPVYYANFAFLYGLGALIEKKQPRRYTYPHHIYVNERTSQNSFATFDSTVLGKAYILKFTPLRLVSLSNPAIEIALEKSMGQRFSTQVMASYLIPSLFDYAVQDWKNSTSGFRFSLEEKLFFKKSSPRGAYLAVELNYLNTRYNEISSFTNGLEYSDSMRTSYLDRYRVYKQTLSINLKYGYQMIKGPWTLDAYVGIGPRYKSVAHFDRIIPEDELERPRHPNFYYYSNVSGDFWTVSLTANIKLGWIIPYNQKF